MNVADNNFIINSRTKFLEGIENSNNKTVCLSTFCQYQTPFLWSQNNNMTKQTLPLTLCELFYPGMISAESTKIFHNLKMHFPPDKLNYLEEVTQIHSLPSVWYKHRKGRITGSVIHSVLRTDMNNPAKTVMDRILSTKLNVLNVPAINWGRDHENESLMVYLSFNSGGGALNNIILLSEQIAHTSFTVRNCGLIDPENPWLGAFSKFNQ